MLDIIKHGPHVLLHQPMKDNVKDGDEIEKLAHEVNKEDEWLVALDVKDRAII